MFCEPSEFILQALVSALMSLCVYFFISLVRYKNRTAVRQVVFLSDGCWPYAGHMTVCLCLRYADALFPIENSTIGHFFLFADMLIGMNVMASSRRLMSLFMPVCFFISILQGCSSAEADFR